MQSVDVSYKEVLINFIEFLKVQEEIKNTSICLIDYVEKKFSYITQNDLFLCGYSVEEVERLGIHFFDNVLYPDDKHLFETINKIAYNFFSNQTTPQNRKNYWASYDLRFINKNGTVKMLHFMFRPLVMDSNGNPIICLIQACLSGKSQSGNLCIYSTKDHQFFEYSNSTRKFIPVKRKKLNESEKQVLILLSQGFIGKEIANKLSKKENTIKYYFSSIHRKLNVSNNNEAVYLYANYGHLL